MDADVLDAKIYSELKLATSDTLLGIGYRNGLRTVRAIIINQPTVDHENQQTHGRWELHGNDDDCGSSYFCSKCGSSYDEDYFYEHEQYIEFNYCPNCGAKMDLEDSGD